MRAVFAIFSRIFLWSFGWKVVNLDLLTRVPNAVCIFTHTSYADFAMMLIHKIAYKEINDRLTIGVKAEAFNKIGGILRYFNCFPVTPLEKKGQNLVAQVVARYRDKNDYWICVDPEGTLKLNEWRSGWYWIANGLSIPITTGALDYHTHKLIFGGAAFESNSEYEYTKSRVMQSMSNITTLYPECSQVSNKTRSSSLIDPVTASIFYSLFILASPLYHYGTVWFLTAFTCWLFSWIYHHSRETSCVHVEGTAAKLWVLSFCAMLIYTGRMFNMSLVEFIMSLTSVISYFMGCGREKCQSRTRIYIYCHSLFHVVGALTIRMFVTN